MRIEAVAAYTAPITSTRLTTASVPTTPAMDPAPAPSPLPDPAPTTPTNPAPTTPTNTEPTFARAHGMLRKLVAGGFNPVAAARHTEKFAEELKQAGVTPTGTKTEPTPAKAKAVKSYAAPAPAPSVDTDA
jgi:hypothetical protein